jgi:SAM-dependent methyltransferase
VAHQPQLWSGIAVIVDHRLRMVPDAVTSLQNAAMTDDRAFYASNSLNVDSYDAETELVQPALAGDVEFYVEQARRSGGPVLDLGGGTGRVAWPLAEAGFEVTSLDASAPMLARSEAKRPLASAAAQGRVTLVHANARDFALPAQFGLAIAPGRTFQLLLTPEDQRAALAAIRRHLRPGGMLVLQLFDPLLEACAAFDGVPSNGDRGTVVLPDSRHRVTRRVLHRTTEPLSQLMTEVWEFAERDDAGTIVRRDEETLRMRWTYRFEMRYLLEACGFEVEGEYSDFRGSPPRYAGEQIWVARRAEVSPRTGAE